MRSARTAGLVCALAMLPVSFAHADDVAATLNGGDTAWMIVATALVLFMTLPGLSLFYGGLVRSKNVLSVLIQCLAMAGVMSLLWVAYGYSLAFTPGGAEGSSQQAIIGGTSKLFLRGVTVDSLTGTIPESLRYHHPSAGGRCLRRTHALFRHAGFLGDLVHLFLPADLPHGLGW
jgi:Amt family ammonium transporter